MRILNLDKNFKPFGEGIEFKKFNFPSGCEPHIKITQADLPQEMLITCRIKSGNDIIELLLATDALKRSGVKDIQLFISYLPFARQDRVMVDGEPLSVKVISDLLNMQGFSSVLIYDPHSEVCLATINNAEAMSNHSFVESVLEGREDYLIVSPDAGAYKKIFKLCQHLHYKGEIIMCNKIRDVHNGVIRSLTVSHDDLQGKDVYIVDDICDGGGTFVLLAEELKKRNPGKINLIVSHGIFSKGLHLQNIDRVYTTDSFQDINSLNDFGIQNERYLHGLKQIKLCTIL